MNPKVKRGIAPELRAEATGRVRVSFYHYFVLPFSGIMGKGEV